MKNIYKAIITFALATLAPTITWIVFAPPLASLIFLFLAIPVLEQAPTLFEGFFGALGSIFIICMVILFSAIFVFIVSIMHILFLAVPTFLVANHLKIIRWYTVLPSSFLIGGAPYLIGGAPYILLILGFPTDNVIGISIAMGLFGVSAGIVFWLLWRYWVSPENYTKKAISIAPQMP